MELKHRHVLNGGDFSDCCELCCIEKASPDLLAHLELAVGLREQDERTGHVNWPKWFDEARALIAKAKGTE